MKTHHFQGLQRRYTLPETDMFAPENRPKPKKETTKFSNHPFSGAQNISFREGNSSYTTWDVQNSCQKMR